MSSEAYNMGILAGKPEGLDRYERRVRLKQFFNGL
jgi:hypothetical protein